MNPYLQSTILSNNDFLSNVYAMMRNKIRRLIEIESGKKRGKLSLPTLKEKYEIANNILEALRHLSQMIDYNNENAKELSDVINDFSISLGIANTSNETEIIHYHYNQCLVILDGFLKD